MYTLTGKERRAKLRKNRPILLQIDVELMGKCIHVENHSIAKCDCSGWNLSPRTQVLLQLGLAQIKYADIDLSFL